MSIYISSHSSHILPFNWSAIYIILVQVELFSSTCHSKPKNKVAQYTLFLIILTHTLAHRNVFHSYVSKSSKDFHLYNVGRYFKGCQCVCIMKCYGTKSVPMAFNLIQHHLKEPRNNIALFWFYIKYSVNCQEDGTMETLKNSNDRTT